MSIELDKSGSATLKIRRTGYATKRVRTTLLRGKTARVNAVLDVDSSAAKPDTTPAATSATISIWVEPWADIYLKGKKIGRAPQRSLRLPIGRHSLRLVNPALGVERTVTVTVPSKRSYLFKLKK